MASSATVTATGTIVATSATLLGVQYKGAAAAGTLLFKDGGASGTLKLTIYTPASAAHADYVAIPGGGIQFDTDIHVTSDQSAGITVIYQ